MGSTIGGLAPAEIQDLVNKHGSLDAAWREIREPLGVSRNAFRAFCREHRIRLRKDIEETVVYSPLRILAIDIETRPALAYIWKVWDENVGVEQIVHPGGMLSFAAKWLGDDEIEFRSDYHDGHPAMVRRVHELLDEADVVLHFNGRRFDVPHLQREFLEAGLLPPAPYKQVDLFDTVKHQFRFLSNKLAHVSKQMGLGGKVEHEGFPLWRKCMEGDADAWARMRTYNLQDVRLLEDAYAILRPWIKSHPSVGAALGDDVCPKCGSRKMEARGIATTQSGQYERFRCRTCGGWARGNRRVAKTSLVQLAVS